MYIIYVREGYRFCICYDCSIRFQNFSYSGIYFYLFFIFKVLNFHLRVLYPIQIHDDMYSMKIYMLMFISIMQQTGRFVRLLHCFTNKSYLYDITEIVLNVVLNNCNRKPYLKHRVSMYKTWRVSRRWTHKYFTVILLCLFSPLNMVNLELQSEYVISQTSYEHVYNN